MKPPHQSEQALIHAILDGRFPPGTRLPAERELATLLGVTRPTLRETLSRLHRDGWITIAHGKATLVNDYWSEGGLNVLSAIVRTGKEINPHFVSWLLDVRRHLAPAYTAAAVAGPALGPVTTHLATRGDLPDSAEALAVFDWDLHRLLSRAAGNPIYTLILNGFHDLSHHLGTVYFAEPANRAASRAFYDALAVCCQTGDPEGARALSAQAMTAATAAWQHLQGAHP